MMDSWELRAFLLADIPGCVAVYEAILAVVENPPHVPAHAYRAQGFQRVALSPGHILLRVREQRLLADLKPLQSMGLWGGHGPSDGRQERERHANG